MQRSGYPTGLYGHEISSNPVDDQLKNRYAFVTWYGVIQNQTAETEIKKEFCHWEFEWLFYRGFYYLLINMANITGVQP